MPLQLGAQTQVPLESSHVVPEPQVPQLPPQPSLPHWRPVQSGTHTQLPEPLQVVPVAHVPQVLPQPSGPHWRPEQLGVHAQAPAEVHAVPDGHVPHTPPQPSSPHSLPAQDAMQLLLLVAPCPELECELEVERAPPPLLALSVPVAPWSVDASSPPPLAVPLLPELLHAATVSATRSAASEIEAIRRRMGVPQSVSCKVKGPFPNRSSPSPTSWSTRCRDTESCPIDACYRSPSSRRSRLGRRGSIGIARSPSARA